VHIPRIPRGRHTPQDTVRTELTKAGVTVDGENSAVRHSVACHLRDSGYTFYRESRLVLEYPRRHVQAHTRVRTHTHPLAGTQTRLHLYTPPPPREHTQED
jgi:hypothetical protein